MNTITRPGRVQKFRGCRLIPFVCMMRTRDQNKLERMLRPVQFFTPRDNYQMTFLEPGIDIGHCAPSGCFKEMLVSGREREPRTGHRRSQGKPGAAPASTLRSGFPNLASVVLAQN